MSEMDDVLDNEPKMILSVIMSAFTLFLKQISI